MGATATIKVKKILFEGKKVKLDTGEVVWIPDSEIIDYLPGEFVVQERFLSSIKHQHNWQDGMDEDEEGDQ